MKWYVSVVGSFLLLGGTPLYGCTTMWVSISLLMGVGVLSLGLLLMFK